MRIEGSYGIQIGDHNQQVVTVAEGALPAPHTVEPPDGTHNLPSPGTGPFVGRDAALHALDAGDSEVIGQTVHGLGGVGKTELVLRHAHARRADYRLVWWVNAASRQDLALGLAQLTSRLHPAPALTEAEAWAVGWLQSHDGWLLVLDNVEDGQDIEALIGALRGRGRILVTTRRNLGDAAWRKLGLAAFELPLLPRDASVELLVGPAADAGERDAARRLAEDLGDLPLALEQAAAYIAQRGVTIADYSERLRHAPRRMHSTAPEGARADRIVARVWSVTMETVLARSHTCFHVMAVMAFLAPEPLPISFLTSLVSLSTLRGHERHDAELDIDDAVALLVSYSMLRRSGGKVTMHRLVQSVVRESLASAPPTSDKISQYMWHLTLALQVLDGTMPADPLNDREGWPWWDGMLPHVVALARILATAGVAMVDPREGRFPIPMGGLLLDRAGNFLLGQGRYAQAIATFEEAIAAQHGDARPENLFVLTTRAHLGTAYRRAGRFEEAIAVLEPLVADAARLAGDDDPRTLEGLQCLADAYDDTGRWSEAVDVLRTVAERGGRTLGTAHEFTLATRCEIARILASAGRPAEALATITEVVAAVDRELDGRDPRALRARDAIGGVYRALGRYDEAVTTFETLVAGWPGVDDARPLDVLIARHNLGLALVEAGRFPEGTEVLESLIGDAERSLGPADRIVLDAREVLVSAYFDGGRPVDALALAGDLVEAFRGAFGPMHPRLLTLRNRVAMSLRAIGMADEAITQLRLLVRDYAAHLPSDHPHALATRGNLATVCLRAGRTDEALEIMEPLYADFVRALGDTHPDTLTCRNNLAHAHWAAGRVDRATALLAENLHHCEQAFGPDDRRTGNARSALADVSRGP